MLTWFRENKRYLLGFGVSALIIFLALHDLNNMYVLDRVQTRIDYMSTHMSTEAFQPWLDEMKSVKTILESAKTNFDAKEALNYTSTARRFANILDCTIEARRQPDFMEHLYFRIWMATFMLDKAVSTIAAEPSYPPPVRNLNDDNLQKLENITATIGNLINSVGTIEDGVDPVEQLKEKGVLNQVINYAKQVQATSIEIWW